MRNFIATVLLLHCVNYLFCPSVCQSSELEVQEFCYTPGGKHDSGNPQNIRNINACYDRPTKTIWISYEHPQSINHEMCHYFCDFTEDPGACDKTCEGVR